MRTVTMRDLNALSAAISEVLAVCAEVKPMCAAAPTIMAANDPHNALLFGLKVAEASMSARQQVLQKFERAAFNFLGEIRREGESLDEYFSRICSMPESELMAAPAHNGLRLDLRTTAGGGAR